MYTAPTNIPLTLDEVHPGKDVIVMHKASTHPSWPQVFTGVVLSIDNENELITFRFSSGKENTWAFKLFGFASKHHPIDPDHGMYLLDAKTAKFREEGSMEYPLAFVTPDGIRPAAVHS